MSNWLKILVMLAVGFVGGLIGSILTVPHLAGTNLTDTTTIADKPTTFISQLDYFSEAIARIEPKVVAIQSFSGGTLVRSGSGIVLTQEGLIGTLNSLAPMQTVQVVANEKIYSGKVVFRNYSQNIAIVSVGGSNWQAAELKKEVPVLGQNLLAFGKTVNFGNDDPLIAEALISQVNPANGYQLKINLVYDPQLFGSAIFDNTGSILGLLDFRYQKPVVIGTKLLEESLLKALAAME